MASGQVSRVKVGSFTVPRDSGWSCVTPIGIITAERGVQVTIVISETWEQAAQAVTLLREQEPETE
jgi:hypothetical protein